MLSESRRDSVGGGGGGSSMNFSFQWSPKAGAINWGGGEYQEFSVNGDLLHF